MDNKSKAHFNTSKLSCCSAKTIIKTLLTPLWPLLFRVEFQGRQISGLSSFGVVGFWGRQILGSSSFGVVEFQDCQVLGSSSFGVVKFWGCQVLGSSSLVVFEY